MILQVQGQQQAEDLRAKIGLAEQKIAALWSQMKAHPAQFQAAIKQDAIALQGLKDQLEETEKAVKKAGSSMSGIGKYGNAIGQVGYAVDDLQYGFKGIANNIQPILSSIPGIGAWAGIISIAAIAGNTLYTNWDKLASLWGGGHTKTQAEEMEELRKKTELTANEAERLARVDNLKNKTDELRSGRTDAQQAEEKVVTHAITEVGSDQVASMVKQYAPDMIKNTPRVSTAQGEVNELEKAKKDYQRRAASPDAQVANEGARGLAVVNEKLMKAREDLAAATEKAAEEFVAQAPLSKEWPAIRKRLEQITQDALDQDSKALGGKGHEFLYNLKQSDPEEVKANKAAEASYKREEDRNKEKKKEAKEEQDLFDDMDKENEQAAKKEIAAARKSKSFLGKDDGELSTNEKIARDEHDKFETGVFAAQKTKSYQDEGKEDNELSPVEKEAKRRDAKEERAHDKEQRELVKSAKDNLDLHPELNTDIKGELLGRQTGGQSADEAGKAVEERLAKVFQDKFGLDDAKSRELAHDKVQDQSKEIRDTLQKGPKEEEKRSSETLGIQEYISKIQGSVTNEDATKESRDILKQMLEEMQKNPEARQKLIATYS